jgi:hypothetical protein
MIKVLWGTGLEVNGQMVPLNQLSELVDAALDLQDLVLLASGANHKLSGNAAPEHDPISSKNEGVTKTEEEGN